MPQTMRSSGKSIAANTGETLLDASLRAGASLLYSCRTDRRSSCRTQVMAATTQAQHDETGPSANESVSVETGTGTVPDKAILESLAGLPTRHQPRSVAVHWGDNHSAGLYWTPSLLAADFRFIPALSSSDDDWTSARGHVQPVMLAHEPDLSRNAVYSCGSDVMIHDAHAQLVAIGLPERRFNSAAFVCSAAF